MEEKNEQWIREATGIEKLYELTHRRKTMLLSYQLSLSSLQPLQDDQVKTALIHLHRKCPALRICYGRRNGQTWLRYMVKEQLDYQVMKDVTPEEIREILMTYQYNTEEGPLWCARLLPNTGSDGLSLDKDLPYTSHLFMGIHHGITDGFTMMKICGNFVRILNDIMDQKSVSDKEQIGYFSDLADLEKLVSAKMVAIQQDPSLMEELNSMTEDLGIGIPLLLEVEPSPEGEDKTCNINHILDRDTTMRFVEKCKAERVSVNSGITAIINASIISHLIDHQYLEDTYRICHGHVVNLRRYLSADNPDQLGCIIRPPINLWSDVPKNVCENLWEFARNIHQDLHHHLKNESILVLEAHTKLTNKEDIGDPNFDDIYYPPNPKQVDVAFSNLGDVTNFYEDSGPYVKPYLLIRQVSLHHTDIRNFAYFYHTFMGRLIFSLHYNTKFSTKAFAQKHCRQVFSMLENAIKA